MCECCWKTTRDGADATAHPHPAVEYFISIFISLRPSADTEIKLSGQNPESLRFFGRLLV